MTISIQKLNVKDIEVYVDKLAELLLDGVNSGASISFIQPFDIEQAGTFWRESVLPNIASGERVLFVAREGEEVLGTVQLIVELPPNQVHRCEVSKLMVDSQQRGKGIGKRLMLHVLEYAQLIGKSLITLDTRTGDVSENLYQSIGFEVAGVIPNFAKDPDSDKLSGTTYMYKHL